ncbi:MAG: tryptophan--tRNA ligase [Bacilli bacterium]|nr:tryptophan--tRNA ligase [Bacilli bacterium]
MKNIILTGDRPTGQLHIGHYVGSLRERLRLQNDGNYDEFIVLIADAQALTDNADNPKKVRDNILEVMLDYLAIGLDPNKVTFAIQSMLPALPELTAYYMNLVSLPRLMRNPTVKSEINLRGFDKEETGLPVGFVNYPISQAADITAFKANIIPVGEDQLPMLEQTREIVRSFNRIYNTNTLVECKAILPTNKTCYRLPGIDGNAKMSKSLGNCIYLADDENTIKKKVNSMKTNPRNIDEPGIIEGNVVFTYLDVFVKDEHFKKYYPEFNNFDELKKAYENGGIGDGKIKAFLNDILQEELKPIREKRNEFAKMLPQIIDILKQGTNKAIKISNQTLRDVKEAMKINYFDNDNLTITNK